MVFLCGLHLDDLFADFGVGLARFTFNASV